MNHFLHLLVLLPALFTTIIAVPTLIDDTSNSWTNPPLENADTLLAATFGGLTDEPLTPPALALPTPLPTQLPPPTIDTSDWSKPMFLCCNSVSWWNSEELQCVQRMEYIQWGPVGEFADPMFIETRSWNDQNCMASQGTAKYCPHGISVSSIFF